MLTLTPHILTLTFLGRALGDMIPLKEIQRMVKEDNENFTRSTEDEEVMMKELAEYREEKKKGVCASNRASVLDARQTITRLHREVCLF